MDEAIKVDVTLNVFGKPRQTALALASLLRHSREHIQKIYLTIERQSPVYDTVQPFFLRDFSDAIEFFVPEHWLQIDEVEINRLGNKAYRHSVRYQYAWEKSAAPYLLVLHNDIYFHKDIIADMLRDIGDAIAIGKVGQCWNCPAARGHVMETLGINNGLACRRNRYEEFRVDFEDLNRMYRYCIEHKEHCRPFLPKWSDEFRERPWPLPECRVNETCCLINLKTARKATVPYGKARPFGAYVSAGSHNMDLAVAWFRDVHHMGYHARNFEFSEYLTHFVGHQRLFNERDYREAEDMAADILRTEYPEYAELCRKAAPGLLD